MIRVPNRRAIKVRDMSLQASEQFHLNLKDEAVKTLKTALNEAEKLHTDKEYHVRICQLNLATAYIHSGDNLKGITILEDILPEAEQHGQSILEDIWYYIGLAKKNSKKGLNLEQSEIVNMRGIFYKAKSYSDEKPVDSSLEDLIIEELLIFESRERERCELQKRIIWMMDRKSENIQTGDSSDNSELRMQRAIECVTLLFKTSIRSPKAVKEEAWGIISRYKLQGELEKSNLQVSTWCDLGLILSQIQEYYMSLKCFEKASQEEERNKPMRLKASDGKTKPRDDKTSFDKTYRWSENVVQIRHNMAAVHVLMGNFSHAVDEYTVHLKRLGVEIGHLHKTVLNRDLRAHVYLNLAFSFLRLGKKTERSSLQDAYKYYEKALKELKDIDYLGVFKCLEGMAATVLTMEQSTSTLERYKLELGLMDCDANKFENAEEIELVRAQLYTKKLTIENDLQQTPERSKRQTAEISKTSNTKE